MVSEGKLPWIDFNYNYGLGTLWLNQAWFSCFGYSPLANLAINVACMLLTCWGVALVISVMEWKGPIVAFVMTGSTYLFCYCWFTTAHGLETALLILCIGLSLRRSYAAALFVATVALLIKPSLAYFAGLFIVLEMIFHRDSDTLLQHVKNRAGQMLPSLLLLVVYSVVVLAKRGWPVLFNSLVPLSGMAGYQESECGFFARGRMFWMPPSNDVGVIMQYYLMTPAGVWLTGSLVLSYFAVKTGLVWMRGQTLNQQQRCIIICAFLHAGFVFILFGNEWSWTYATYLVLFGVAACCSLAGYASRIGFMVVSAWIVLSMTGIMQTGCLYWNSTRSYADMDRLFLTESMHQELTSLRQLAGERTVLFFGRQGAASMLVAPVKCPDTWAYMRSSAKEAERRSLLESIDQADIVVLPLIPAVVVSTTWPEIACHLERMTVRKESKNHLYLTTAAQEARLREHFQAIGAGN